jgi:hypothetical protein
VAALCGFVLLAGCGEDPPAAPGNDAVSDQPISKFSLIDVNPNSGTYDQAVSPRDYLGKATAWYFGRFT